MSGTWTEADRDIVKEAIVKLVSGQRAVTVSLSGGGVNKSVTYSEADLPSLRRLLNEIVADLTTQNGGVSCFTAYTGKGL
jgi:hypothetical protein